MIVFSLRTIAATVAIFAGCFASACIDPPDNRIDRADNLLTGLVLYQQRALFLAGGSACTLWTSADGRSWTARQDQLPGCASGVVNGLAYMNGRFVAVGARSVGACGIWSSVNGLEWTEAACPSDVVGSLTALAAGGGEFVAVGSAQAASNFQSASSNDGVTWTSLTYPEPGSSGIIDSVTYSSAGNRFMLFQSTPQGVRRREPGAAWDTRSATTGLDASIIVYGPLINGVQRAMIAGNSAGFANCQFSDDDGVSAFTTCTTGAFGGSSGAPRAATFGAGKRYVMVRDLCEVSTSALGAAADPAPYAMTACSLQNLLSVAYLNDRFFAGGSLGGIYSSTSGFPAEWSQATSSGAGASQAVRAFAYRPGGF